MKYCDLFVFSFGKQKAFEIEIQFSIKYEILMVKHMSCGCVKFMLIAKHSRRNETMSSVNDIFAVPVVIVSVLKISFAYEGSW